MELKRSNGILHHITSLPGRYGIGTLGPEARVFADTLIAMGMRYWQILPIGPVDAARAYSPYASSSTFAGNPLFISLEWLRDKVWFSGFDDTPFPEYHFILFENVINHKMPILRRACEEFFTGAGRDAREKYTAFCDRESYWLYDYSLFAALSEEQGTQEWRTWGKELAERDISALARAAKQLEAPIRFYSFIQYLFFTQWNEMKEYVNAAGIHLIGDIPIYITMDSADAWAHPEILELDEESGEPVAVAGVPPDYFSETGQRWGNPIYKWLDRDRLYEPTFRWWRERVSHLVDLVDILRIDHFRGFEAYWSIPYKEKTAVKGQWVTGPGAAFFERLRDELGALPLIAEDLGVITPAVEKLRDDFFFPGMKILQFAFDFNSENYYLPHNITQPNCVLYTGTHDNNTVNGWFYGGEIDDAARAYVCEYLGVKDDTDFHRKMVRQAFRSTANLVIIPTQDILGYGADFRMNTPGTIEGNWGWKLTNGAITEYIISSIKRMGKIYGRISEKSA